MHATAKIYTRKYSVEYFGRSVDRVHQRMHNGAEIQIEKGGDGGVRTDKTNRKRVGKRERLTHT